MGQIKLWSGWYISLEKKKNSEPIKPKKSASEFSHFEKEGVIERKKINHNKYALMVKEIQKNFPVGDVFNNPLDCGFLIRVDNDGYEEPDSSIKNHQTISDYRNRRIDKCIEFLGLVSIPHLPECYINKNEDKFLLTNGGFKKIT